MGVWGLECRRGSKSQSIIADSALKCPQIQKKTAIRRLPSGELAGARTQDPNIKSVVLYLLSYEINAKKVGRIRFGGANVAFIFVLAK